MLSLGLVISLLFCVSAYAQSIKNTSKEIFYTEEEVFNAWDLSESEKEDYAGLFMDDNGNLVLQFLKDSISYTNALEKVKNNNYVLTSKDGLQQQKLLIKPAQYSYKELYSTYNIVTEKGYEKKIIKTFSINVKENCIDVGLTDIESKDNVENDLLELVKENGVNTKSGKIFNFIRFDEEKDTIKLTININGNTGIHTRPNNNLYFFSPGTGDYYNSSSQRGFVSCGHGLSVNNIVYAGSTRIGVVKKVVFNGICDASFILFGSEDSFVSNVNQYETLSWDVPIVGGNITQRGSNTPSQTAQVLSNTFSYTGNGFTWTNLIQTNKTIPSGDSGGGAKCGVTDGGRTAKIVAINHASSSTRGYLIRGKVVDLALS